MESPFSKTLRQRGEAEPQARFQPRVSIVGLDFGTGGQPVAVRFADGHIGQGCCIRCQHQPCIRYSEDEVAFHALPAFPSDASRNVCPTEAITWPEKSSAPIINSNRCVLCGLCVARCPAGALHLASDATVVIQTKVGPDFLETKAPSASTTPPTRTGRMLRETPHAVATILTRVNAALQTDDEFPPILSRNLLIGLGFSAAARRKGDVNMRMDLLLGPPGTHLGTAEVELDAVTLIDAPRNVLDNVAVLTSRLGAHITPSSCLVISTALPNERSEYWQLIDDIHKVLHLEIGSVTLPALILMVWNGASLSLIDKNPFYVGAQLKSIRLPLETLLRRSIDLPVGFEAALECQK